KADGWKFRLTHGSAHSQTSAHKRTVIAPTTASRAGTERRSSEKPDRDGATVNSPACSLPTLLVWSMDAAFPPDSAILATSPWRVLSPPQVHSGPRPIGGAAGSAQAVNFDRALPRRDAIRCQPKQPPLVFVAK